MKLPRVLNTSWQGDFFVIFNTTVKKFWVSGILKFGYPSCEMIISALCTLQLLRYFTKIRENTSKVTNFHMSWSLLFLTFSGNTVPQYGDTWDWSDFHESIDREQTWKTWKWLIIWISIRMRHYYYSIMLLRFLSCMRYARNF